MEVEDLKIMDEEEAYLLHDHESLLQSVHLTEITKNSSTAITAPQVSSCDDDDDNDSSTITNTNINNIIKKGLLAAQAPGGRRRLFSIDVSEDITDNNVNGLNLANIDSDQILDSLNPTLLLSEMSIDLNLNVNMNMNAQCQRRDRGFSFEFFSFQTDDNPNNNDVTSATASRRERGDSIIFDPMSFNDGGIHEESALRLCSAAAAKSSSSSDVSSVPVLLSGDNSTHNHTRRANGIASSPKANGLQASASVSNNNTGSSSSIVVPIISKMQLPDSIISSSKINTRTNSKTVTNSSSSLSLLHKNHPPRLNTSATAPMTNRSRLTNSSTHITRSQLLPLHQQQRSFASQHTAVSSNGTINPLLVTSNANTYLHNGGNCVDSSCTVSHQTHPASAQHSQQMTNGDCQQMLDLSQLNFELINKGGRIGIYLPAARKERLAKFHRKRQNRIWRKRIKYDCRKKLADSRPRIKGRFVKRSDMSTSTAEDTVVVVPSQVTSSTD